ncbi:unnamed protein product [Nyctereutes procyonoides]|uniref:(raccoon dog) hypothetical protein n=1 Tax=Nyctereutes procyonoides TaxID=34880 RepID=A0A811Z9Y1_NYCPR|nr:unnamed protein product [Nyctereutes procyonoides]
MTLLLALPTDREAGKASGDPWGGPIRAPEERDQVTHSTILEEEFHEEETILQVCLFPSSSLPPLPTLFLFRRFSSAPLGESFPASSNFWWPQAFLGMWLRPSSICLHLHMASPLCVCVQISLFGGRGQQSDWI